MDPGVKGQLVTGQDSQDHIGHVLVEQVSIAFTWGDQRCQWRSNQMGLDMRSPKRREVWTEADVVKLWTDLARKGIRQMLKTPPPPMRREVA